MNLFKSVISKNLKERKGVYMIKCKNHFYIGSSINLYNRLMGHKSRLKSNRHENKFMSNCYSKYGKDTFDTLILEYCEDNSTIQDVRTREKYWMDRLNPNMNSEKDPVTKAPTKDARSQISNTLKDGYSSGRITPTNMKPILVYNLDGSFKGEYVSCSEAARQLNLNFKKVSLVALGKQAYHRGYTFKYK